MSENYDVVILGGGPAGLAATAYALYARLRVALVSPDLGGKVSYPFVLRGAPAMDTVWGAGFVHELEQRVIRDLQHHIQDSASRVEAEHDGGFRVHLNDGDALGARAIVVATGARPQRLFVEGEMEYWGRGLSFSAVSHAPLFGGRTVAVVGGGDRAIRAVRLLIPFVDHLFYVAARPQHISDPAIAERVLAHPKVSVFQGWEVQQISGDDFVTGIDLVGVNGEVRSLAVEGVFVQFGLLPNNSAIRDLISLDEQGHVIVDAQANTSLPGIFAAGDVTNAYAEQVPVSIGDGSKAGISAWHHVAGL